MVRCSTFVCGLSKNENFRKLQRGSCASAPPWPSYGRQLIVAPADPLWAPATTANPAKAGDAKLWRLPLTQDIARATLVRLPNGHLTEDTAMRIAHDWGRASRRPHRSAPVGCNSYYVRTLLCGAAAALAACDSSPKSATSPTDPVNAMGSREDESVRTEVRGVAYPRVAVKPSADVDMSIGQQSSFSALLSEPNGNAWASCCSTWKSSDASVASVDVTGYGGQDGERGIVVAHRAGSATITVTTQSGTSGTLKVTVGSSSTGSGSAGASSGGTGGSSGGSGSGGPSDEAYPATA